MRLCRGLDGRLACVGCPGVLGGWARRIGVHGILQHACDVKHARVCVSIPVPRAMRDVLTKNMVCALLAVHSRGRVRGVMDVDPRPCGRRRRPTRMDRNITRYARALPFERISTGVASARRLLARRDPCASISLVTGSAPLC